MRVFTAYQTCHSDPSAEGEAPTSSRVPGGVGKSQAEAITSLLGWEGLHILVSYSSKDLRPLATLGVTSEKLAHRVSWDLGIKTINVILVVLRSVHAILFQITGGALEGAIHGMSQLSGREP